jgi:hypothetical protein
VPEVTQLDDEPVGWEFLLFHDSGEVNEIGNDAGQALEDGENEALEDDEVMRTTRARKCNIT